MVYKRIKCIRYKNGKTYCYAYLVKSTWMKGEKTARQKVIKYLGKVEGLEPFVAEEIWKRDDWKCVVCGSEEEITIEHRLPLSKDGNNDSVNLETYCRLCNQKKGKKVA